MLCLSEKRVCCHQGTNSWPRALWSVPMFRAKCDTTQLSIVGIIESISTILFRNLNCWLKYFGWIVFESLEKKFDCKIQPDWCILLNKKVFDKRTASEASLLPSYTQEDMVWISTLIEIKSIHYRYWLYLNQQLSYASGPARLSFSHQRALLIR